MLRSVRADFAPELWRGLGEPAAPEVFTRSELFVAVGVLVVSGFVIYLRSNRVAFFVSLTTGLTGFVLIAGALVGLQAAQRVIGFLESTR